MFVHVRVLRSVNGCFIFFSASDIEEREEVEVEGREGPRYQHLKIYHRSREKGGRRGVLSSFPLLHTPSFPSNTQKKCRKKKK